MCLNHDHGLVARASRLWVVVCIRERETEAERKEEGETGTGAGKRDGERDREGQHFLSDPGARIAVVPVY